MARFRIETAPYGNSGMFVATAFAEPGGEVIARSEAIFHDDAEATAAIVEMFRLAWPDRAPDAVDHSIGV